MERDNEGALTERYQTTNMPHEHYHQTAPRSKPVIDPLKRIWQWRSTRLLYGPHAMARRDADSATKKLRGASKNTRNNQSAQLQVAAARPPCRRAPRRALRLLHPPLSAQSCCRRVALLPFPLSRRADGRESGPGRPPASAPGRNRKVGSGGDQRTWVAMAHGRPVVARRDTLCPSSRARLGHHRLPAARSMERAGKWGSRLVSGGSGVVHR